MRLVACITAIALAVQSAPSCADAPTVFEQLKLLAGTWEAELAGFGKLTSVIRVVSNGRAVEETIGTPGDNELSVYTVNGNRLLLTHYCALTPDGHQVRLETARIGPEFGQLLFAFSGATNLHQESAAHMRRMVLTIADRDHYAEQWIKTERGKDSVFELHFVRQ
jgi:hypothetical protein